MLDICELSTNTLSLHFVEKFMVLDLCHFLPKFMFMVLTIVQLVEPYDVICVQIVATQGLAENREFKVSVCFLKHLFSVCSDRNF